MDDGSETKEKFDEIVLGLRNEVSTLQQLLEEERAQWKHNENESLLLLQKVKQQWKERESETLSKMESEMAACKEEEQRLIEVKQQLKHKLSDCKSKLEVAVRAFEQEQSNSEALTASNKNFELQMKEQSGLIQDLKNEIGELKREKLSAAEKENELEVQQAKSLEVQLALKEKEDVVKELKSKLNAEQEKWQHALRSVEEESKNKMKSIEEQLHVKNKALLQLESDFKIEKDKVIASEEKLQRQHNTMEDLTEKLGILQEESSTKTNTLQCELEIKTKQLDELLKSKQKESEKEHEDHLAVADMRMSLEDSNRKLEAQNLKLDQLTSVIQELEKQNERSEDEYKEKCDQLEALKSGLEEKIKELEESNKDYKQASERDTNSLISQLETVRNDLAQKEEEVREGLRKLEKMYKLEEEVKQLKSEKWEQAELSKCELGDKLKDHEQRYQLLVQTSERDVKELEGKLAKVQLELGQKDDYHMEEKKAWLAKISELEIQVEEKNADISKQSELNELNISSMLKDMDQKHESFKDKSERQLREVRGQLEIEQKKLLEREEDLKKENQSKLEKMSKLEVQLQELLPKCEEFELKNLELRTKLMEEQENRRLLKETSEKEVATLTKKLEKSQQELTYNEHHYEADMKKKSAKISELENLMKSLESTFTNEDKENSSSIISKANENVKFEEKMFAVIEIFVSLLSVMKMDGVALKERNAELESRVKFLRSLMAERRQQFDVERDNLHREVQNLKQQVAKIEEESKKEQNSREVEQTRLIDTLKSEKDSLAIDLEKSKRNLEELRELERSEREELKRENEALKEYASSNKTLKHACLEMQDQIRQYEKVLEKKKSEEDSLNEKITQVSKLKEELKKTKIAQNETQSKLIKNEAFAREVKEHLRAAESQLEFHKKRVEQSDRQLEELKVELRKDELSAMESAKVEEHLKERMTNLTTENRRLEGEVRKLKEETSDLKTHNSKVEAASDKMASVVEETMAKIEEKNTVIVELKKTIDQKENELEEKRVQFNQVTKLVDHLDTAKISPVSYSELLEKLDSERSRVNQLEEQLKLHKTKPSLAPIDLGSSKLMSSSEPRHKIPHRFSRQTNLSSHKKCFVCQTSISIFDSMAVCKYCHVVTHSGVCQTRAKHDCGLPSDLASVIQARGQLVKKGNLKVASCQGRVWSPCRTAQLFTDKFVVDDGDTFNAVIDMDKCLVFETVSVQELLHVPEPSQLHQSFKLVHVLNGKIHESIVLMAESPEEKRSWLYHLANASSFASPTHNKLQTLLYLNSKDGSSNGAIQVHSIYQLTEDFGEEESLERFILATNRGLMFYFENDAKNLTTLSLKALPSATPCFTTLPIRKTNDILLTLGEDRQLVLLKRSDIKAIKYGVDGQSLSFETVQGVGACHLIAISENFLAVADDSRVSILSIQDERKGLSFSLLFAFSTDQPSLALSFRSSDSSLLVATNDVYEVFLDDFRVHEFFSCRNRTNKSKLVDILSTPLGDLICFQNEAHLVTASGISAKIIPFPGDLIDYSIISIKSSVIINTTTGIHKISLEEKAPGSNQCLKGLNNYQLLPGYYSTQQPLIACTEAKSSKRAVKLLQL